MASNLMSYRKNLQVGRQNSNMKDKCLEKEVPLKREAGLLGDQNSTKLHALVQSAWP